MLIIYFIYGEEVLVNTMFFILQNVNAMLNDTTSYFFIKCLTWAWQEQREGASDFRIWLLSGLELLNEANDYTTD